jgi:hypothetical protein
LSRFDNVSKLDPSNDSSREHASDLPHRDTLSNPVTTFNAGQNALVAVSRFHLDSAQETPGLPFEHYNPARCRGVLDVNVKNRQKNGNPSAPRPYEFDACHFINDVN